MIRPSGSSYTPVIGAMCSSAARAVHVTLSCEIITPFGSPVVPELVGPRNHTSSQTAASRQFVPSQRSSRPYIS